MYEPFGIINLEAMACQTAVIASNIGGIPMVVEDGKTGLLVEVEPEGFDKRLANTINELMNDPKRCSEMGRLGRQRVEATFSWQAVAKQTSALYQQLLS